MTARPALFAFALFAATVAAQQPDFIPEDFVDPAAHAEPLFISRLIAGAGRGIIDGHRSLGQDAAFLHIANSFYWRSFQFNYERTEISGEDESDPGRVQVCFCEEGPVYFPTPPARDATPAPPLPGSRDALRAAWYRTASRGEGRLPVTLRSRLSWSRQAIGTELISISSGEPVGRLRGSEQSFSIDADTHVRIVNYDAFGRLQFGRTVRSGTTGDRSQNELTYTARFPAVTLRRVLLQPTFTIGGVSDRGGPAINVVSPAFEAFWHDDATRANFHLVWRPHSTRSGRDGWETTHQIAFFVDRALLVKFFGSRKRSDSSSRIATD